MFLILSGDISLNPGSDYNSHLVQMNGMSLKQKEST